ncbi:MAG: peptidoglycan bridge formation glycyltransferase FemA/FemB family protein [Patescibacteria group bacterium]|nr:peptidoglycan bridge formation glycyltransferase FemA/FemB family protein [Patescibacteria group bacterium]
MIIRPISEEEREVYNQVVNHPLQTWEWGEFRQNTGVKVERIGFFKKSKVDKALQVTFHPVPHFPQYSIGYCPRAFCPNEDQLSALKQLGKKHNALFIKLEPNVVAKVGETADFKQLAHFLIEQGCQPGRPLFTKHTFQLDLTQSEEDLFANLKSKTRYNANLAQRKGVKILEDSSQQGLQTYLDILQETINRQGFYAHNPEYFKKMWEMLGGNDMMHIFHAVYDDTTLASWIIFKLNDTLYYPYGASRSIHRKLMASNLMMWEMIVWGKNQGCKIFDMWGSLGPKPDKKNPWYGFHRFKKGYGGDLMRFIGTYDLVLNYPLYGFFRFADNIRWKWLRFKTKLSHIF